MRPARTRTIAATAFALLFGTTAGAERLELSYLPPDFPPTDICRATVEQVGSDETQVTDTEAGADAAEEVSEWIAFLNRDIRELSRHDAVRHFNFIKQLIALKAEVDPGFGPADEAFAIIDLHVDAGRIEQLKDAGLITRLADVADQLSQSERVRLARHFLTGTGVAADPARGEAMLTTEAYSGNANALLEILRLQLAGVELSDWFVDPERTATLAFGGKLGQLNAGLCARAEFIARAYEDGDLLRANPELAFAWRKFAADQGGQDAAWRVVEHMLNAGASAFETEDILHYLRLATDDTYLLNGEDVDAVRNAGARRADEIAETLARLHGHTTGRNARMAMPYFELPVSVEAEGLGGESPHLSYLRRITQFPDPPGLIWRRLADEVVLQSGRWAGEAEARDALERAVEAGDPEAHLKLASMLLRDGEMTGESSPSERLLLDAVDVHGYAEAQLALDAYYRCTAQGAPLEAAARYWSSSATATSALGLSVDDQDYTAINADTAPELVALLQKRAMEGSSAEMAGFLRRLEGNPAVLKKVLRHWVRRVGYSKKSLELYSVGAYGLAETPEQAAIAVDFARRAQLVVGPAMALDLAVILVEHSGRRPETAAEVRRLLTEAGYRGEGAAIRLLHRLDRVADDRIFRQFAEAIETRGDFLALMFASRFVDEATFDDYMARAVAEMNCGTKDVSELMEAFAARGRADAAMRWLQVALAIEGGHSMSRLGIALQQMDMFSQPLRAEAGEETLNDLADLQLAYHRVSYPRSERFDRAKAAGLIAQALTSKDREVRLWAYETYAEAERGIRRTLNAQVDVAQVLSKAAETGLAEAQHAYGLHLRDKARNASDLTAATRWLNRAAEDGNAGAMVDYAYMLAHGLGATRDPQLAMIWLRRADALVEPRADRLARLVSAMMDED